jgi:hypothetical protein
LSDRRTTRLRDRLVVAGLVAFVMFWIYALFVAPPAPQDKLKDASFARAAQGVCTSALDDLRADNLLNRTAATPGERADLVERSDTRLTSMVQQLRPLTPASVDDAHAVSSWLDDWDQWLSDRGAWVAKLRAGRDVSFDEKADVNGAPNSKALVAFAITNEMPACVTPFGV